MFNQPEASGLLYQLEPGCELVPHFIKIKRRIGSSGDTSVSQPSNIWNLPRPHKPPMHCGKLVGSVKPRPDAAGHYRMWNRGKVIEDTSQTVTSWLEGRFSQSGRSRDARMTSFGVPSRKPAQTGRHGECGDRGVSNLRSSVLAALRASAAPAAAARPCRLSPRLFHWEQLFQTGN